MSPASVLAFYHRAETFGGSFNSVRDVLARADRTRFRPVAAVPGPGNVADDLRARDVSVLFRAEHPGRRSPAYAAAVISAGWLLARHRIGLVYISDYVTWRSAELCAARLLGIPRVVHVRSPLALPVVDPELVAASIVVGNSAATIRALAERLPAERRRVIYNFVDLDEFRPGPDRRGEWFADHPPVVGFVGVFRPEKGIEYFIEMARRIHAVRADVRFLAVGGESVVTDVGWTARMRRLAADFGLEDIVRFTGSRTDVADLMRAMDVLVVPSLNEGFGRVIIEANAVGIPVVGADAAGIPEVVEPGVTGALVPPRDAGAMADAVLQMLDDQAWCRQVRHHAPARVRERFSPEAQMRALEDAWSEAIRDARRHRRRGAPPVRSRASR